MDRPLHIILVEDCESDAELLALVFEDAGWTVAWTRVDSAPALHAALAAGADLVLSDYNLPGFDGLQALAICRDVAPDTPFVFCCGESDSAFEHAARTGGARACVLKRALWTVPDAVRPLVTNRPRA